MNNLHIVGLSALSSEVLKRQENVKPRKETSKHIMVYKLMVGNCPPNYNSGRRHDKQTRVWYRIVQRYIEDPNEESH